jgi:uncharacterized membrane protein (DUF4010 family)
MQLWLRSLDGSEVRVIPGTEGVAAILVTRQPVHRFLRGLKRSEWTSSADR